MATLVFSALGTLIGGPIGGAIGALAGRQVDAAIIGSGTREGPRLTELAVTTSSYGAAIPRLFGRTRAAGTIIWATDLVEHRNKSGGGKGRPSTVSYSYSASFAVALSSRPIESIGRIWADGNLLRGSGGDLKAAGSLRVHTGYADQDADPLIAAAEGSALCPAHRGLAYVVFEDLDLSDFGNRIPALSFEVVADSRQLELTDLLASAADDHADADVALPGLAGFAAQESPQDTLAMLDPFWPIACDAADRLVYNPERLQAQPIALGEAAITTDDNGKAPRRGFIRKRDGAPRAVPRALRYYDLARDYQPGLQQAAGQAMLGALATIELPATLDAADAQRLVSALAQRSRAGVDAITWRCAALDPAVRPGAVVSLPGDPARWRVRDWEWQADGVELGLVRLPSGAGQQSAPADPGRPNLPQDRLVSPTILAAFELPTDGTGQPGQPAIFAAVSAATSAWSGAALFAEPADGALEPLGPSGRTRAIVGRAAVALAPAAPLVVDRTSTVEVALADPLMTLTNATPTQLAAGANRCLIGNELIQFAAADPLGQGRWLLRTLLRGRGGTEQAISLHANDEPFVMLDDALTALAPGAVGSDPGTRIAALGRGDQELVVVGIANRGLTLRPPAPVHGRMANLPDGSLVLQWTRRARGVWQWSDGIDVPLVESGETYDVEFGTEPTPAARWTLAEPRLVVDAAMRTALLAQVPQGAFRIRQRGDHASSSPLVLRP